MRSDLQIQGSRTIGQGDRGVRVEYVQRAMSKRKLFTGPVDGRFGIVLSKAVRHFQQSQGLPVTGDVNARTWEAMFARAK